MNALSQSRPHEKPWEATVGRRLVILGAGGTAIDYCEAAEAAGNEVLGLLDDRATEANQGLYPVLGPLDAWRKLPPDVLMFLGIGSVASHRDRLQIVERLAIPADRYATIIHPRASISPSAVIGLGSGVLAHAAVGARVRVGSHVEVLQLCLIGHDCRIEDGAVVSGSASLSGNVQIGRCAFIGAGATVRNGLHVGDGALLGMNSTLLEHLPEGAVYAGSPARPVRKPAAKL